MSSGIKVSKEVKELLEEMRLYHSKDVKEKRIRILTMAIVDTDIVVEDIIREEDLVDKGNAYTYLQTFMQDKDCKYIMYDCHYLTARGLMKDTIFMMWSSDNAVVKGKMSYASSKICLKSIAAAKHSFELHEREEISPERFAERLSKSARVEITHLEGLVIKS